MPSSVIHIVLISTYKNLLAHNRMILFFDFSDNLNLTHYNSNDFVQILVYKLVGGEGKWKGWRYIGRENRKGTIGAAPPPLGL